MGRLVLIAIGAITLGLTVPRSSAQEDVASQWLNLVISIPSASSRGVDKFFSLSVEHFINQTCQPSDLTGIQVLSVQTDHNESFHLHIFCRHDKATTAHYKVSWVSIPSHLVDKTVRSVVGKPNAPIGLLYLGSTDDSDAILLIEKAR